MLDLNDTQESTLGLIFHWADQRGLPLLDTKDLRAVIHHLLSDDPAWLLGVQLLDGVGASAVRARVEVHPHLALGGKRQTAPLADGSCGAFGSWTPMTSVEMASAGKMTGHQKPPEITP